MMSLGEALEYAFYDMKWKVVVDGTTQKIKIPEIFVWNGEDMEFTPDMFRGAMQELKKAENEK